MGQEHRKEGTILDGRYRIRRVLGQGGFGVTYEAEDLRLGRRVAVKELFRQERADGPEYPALKEKFAREARILREFDREPGVVRVLDFFEEGGAAYLVMEYLEGKTLRQYIQQYGVFEPEDLFRRILPLLESLGRIHESGVIHRDISPDNLMVLEDGSLKLLDFGAARPYKTAGGGPYTALVRENYAPSEQFDRNGRQGPWTDVYALCATVYEGITGCPPESAVQRMFLDELKKPSELGVALDPAYEKILWKGLAMDPADRYASAGQMKQAVEEALPLLVEPVRRKRRRGPAAALLACLGLAALAAGVFLYREQERRHPFRNVETETFRLTASADMTAEEFAAAQIQVEERLADMAGEGNYLFQVDGDSITVTLPLEEFEGQEIGPVLESRFVSVQEGKPFSCQYEIQAEWEDPSRAAAAGKNQCLPEELEGITVTQVYAGQNDGALALTAGERSSLLTDLKARLDCLGAPYALGTLYGSEGKLVVRMEAERTGEWILDSLGQNGMLYIQGRWNCDSLSVFRSAYREGGVRQLSVEEDGNGGVRLACQLADTEDAARLRELSAYSLETGEPRLYLKLSGGGYLAGAPLSEPLEGGRIVFTEFYLENQKENLWPALDYLCALVNDTHLPALLLPEARAFQDAEGEMLFDGEGAELYGLSRQASPREEEWDALTARMEADGWKVQRGSVGMVWISLGLPVEDGLLEDGLSQAAELIRRYQLDRQWGTFYLCLTDEPGEERCRIVVADASSQRAASVQLVLAGETMAPYREAAQAAWQDFPLEEGMIREPLQVDGEIFD